MRLPLKASPSSKRSWRPRKRRRARTRLQVDHQQMSRTFNFLASSALERHTGDTTLIWSTYQPMRPICLFRLLTRWILDGRPIPVSIKSTIPTTDPTATKKSSCWHRQAASQSERFPSVRVPTSNKLSNWLKSIKKLIQTLRPSLIRSFQRTSTGVMSVATTS